MAFPTYSDSVDVAQLQTAVAEMIGKRVQGGLTTAITDANGDMTITHSLGVAPSSAIGNVRGTGLFFVTVVSTTSTTVTYRIHRNTGAAVNAVSIPLHWMVVA